MEESAIAQMVTDMVEETELRANLDGIVETIFRRQLRESFEFPEGPEAYWSAVEAQWRTVTGNQPVPTKYRTNKSVILKAHKANTLFEYWTDKDGDVMGKTAIQNATSEAGKLTREGAYKKIIHVISKVKDNDPSGMEYAALLADVVEYINEETCD